MSLCTDASIFLFIVRVIEQILFVKAIVKSFFVRPIVARSYGRGHLGDYISLLRSQEVFSL